MECATLNVPLDWSNLDGPTIGLALAKNPAAGDRKGSVLTNPGGPGGSGVEFVQQGIFSEQAFEELRASYDILGWDPRGVGGSQSVQCGDDTSDYLHLDSDPDSDAEQAALDAAAAKVAEACAELGEDFLSHISTEDTVMDMEAIRRTIGDEGLTYYGFSYGTTLGSVYADTFPRNVRAIVLDGVTDPSADLEEFLAVQTAAFDRQLNSIFDTCGGLDECPTDDPAALYDEVARQLEQEPLTAGGTPVGPAELAVAAIAITYVDGAEADFIPALLEATEGSGERLASLADIYYGSTEFDPYLAIECVDQPHPVGDTDWQEFADRMVAISPRLGASVANELLPCANWSVEARGLRPMPVATGAPPILVVGNSGDAATPIEQAVAMADSLSSGVLVTSEGLGHTSYGNSCVDAITAAYLLDLKVPPAGTTC
jgi:pimeloyl-ACP methyl ester carboxylesterase